MSGYSSSTKMRYMGIPDQDITNSRASLIQETPESTEGNGRGTVRNAAAGSKWAVGWKTPTLMWSFYVIALVIALLHLGMFLLLHHKPAQGHKSIPQSYVATASNILASLFAISLNTALSISFTQHLWRVFRKYALKGSTVEALYTVLSDPTSFFTREGARRAPFVLLIALLIWTTSIATSFPPGGLTVGNNVLQHFTNTTVPTFDPSYIGSGRVGFLNTSLAMYDPNLTGNGSWMGLYLTGTYASLLRLSAKTMVGERMILPQSPCGSNCSYELAFDGPSVSCTESVSNRSMNLSPPSAPFVLYSATWPDFDAKNTASTLTATTNRFIGYDSNFPTSNQVVFESRKMQCLASATQYSVNVTYINSVPSIAISTGPSRVLGVGPATSRQAISLFECPLSCACCIDTETFALTMPSCACAGNAQWSQEKLNKFRDDNIVALVDSTMIPLTGAYVSTISPSHDLPKIHVNVTYDNSSSSLAPVIPGTITDYNIFTDVINGTIVADTAINQNLLNQSLSILTPPALSVTESILNELLQNVTLSILSNVGIWNATVNTTVSTTDIVYEFSRPLNIILPYSISLFIALFFLILGTVSLVQNGVPAKHGSFMQIVVALTGSDILKTYAAPGCLGGSQNFPQELKDTSIQFGDLAGAEGNDSLKKEGAVRRAGFGVRHEVRPLMRTARYGFARKKPGPESDWI